MSEETKKYPIGGYAPGNYQCKCITCQSQFIGDKRAVQCEPCAVEMVTYKPKPNSINPFLKTNDSFKQEILEEAAENHWKMQYIMSLDESTKPYIIQDFIAGANWKSKRIEELRDELYNQLPTGEVNAFDLIKIITNHIKKLDELI